MATSGTPAPLTPLSAAELGIRRRYRERTTLFWLVSLLLGIAFVTVALALGVTGWQSLTVVGAYSAVCLLMAVRSGVLLSRLRA